MSRASAALALLWWLASQAPIRHLTTRTRHTPEEGTHA